MCPLRRGGCGGVLGVASRARAATARRCVVACARGAPCQVPQARPCAGPDRPSRRGQDRRCREEALLRALAMAEYLETHARRIYGATDTIDIIAAEAILTHVRRGALKDGFTARDVHRPGWSKLTDQDHVRRGLDLLVELDHLAADVSSTASYGGRPKVSYRINPASRGSS